MALEQLEVAEHETQHSNGETNGQGPNTNSNKGSNTMTGTKVQFGSFIQFLGAYSCKTWFYFLFFFFPFFCRLYL